MYTIIETKTEYIKNPKTKTTYIEMSKEVNEIFDKEHYLTTSDNIIKFFRRLRGKETVTRGYTCAGYKVVKLVNTSPDKQSKIIREYKFKAI